MNDYQAIDHYLTNTWMRALAELSGLCAQPSVAAQNLGIQDCALLVAEMLRKRGFTGDICHAGARSSMQNVKGAAIKPF